MTIAAPESSEDAAVAAALGVGGQEAPELDEQAQVAEDTAFEDLPQSWQEEIRRLRREAAQNRVARRDATRQQQPDGGDDKAPSAQALRAAEERGRQAARLENGVRLAGAEVRAALAGSMTEEQIEDVIDDLNLSRFVNDDGDVDRDAVKHLRDKFVSILGKKPAVRPGHANRQGVPTKKSNADLFGEWLHGQ